MLKTLRGEACEAWGEGEEVRLRKVNILAGLHWFIMPDLFQPDPVLKRLKPREQPSHRLHLLVH